MRPIPRNLDALLERAQGSETNSHSAVTHKHHMGRELSTSQKKHKVFSKKMSTYGTQIPARAFTIIKRLRICMELYCFIPKPGVTRELWKAWVMHPFSTLAKSQVSSYGFRDVDLAVFIANSGSTRKKILCREGKGQHKKGKVYYLAEVGRSFILHGNISETAVIVYFIF